MGKKTPKAPDPVQSATAQATLDHVSQYTPWGSSVYSQTGTDSKGVPMYRQDTTLTPQQQQLFDQQQAQDLQLGDANQNYANRISKFSAQGFGLGNMKPLQYSAQGGPIQGSIDKGRALQYNVGDGDTSGQVDRAINAVYNQKKAFLDPQYENSEKQMTAKLANQGITQGTEAWKNAFDEFNRNKSFDYNNASDSAVQAGLGAQNQFYGQDLASGNFYNQAAGQDFSRELGAGEFANNAQQQGFGQNYQNAELNNAAQQQAFQQQAYIRNEPINQYTALNGLTQVQSPQFGTTTPSPNIAGMYQNNYNTALANANNQRSGLFGLGGSALAAAGPLYTAFSDVRLKKDIERIGETPAGIPVYEFKYIGSDDKQTGVMAQDVELVIPDAVVIDASGYKKVNYAMVR